MKPLHIIIPANLKYLDYVREIFRSFCNCYTVNSELISDVILAVDEALCNVIEHNYKNSSCGIVKATFKISKKKLSIIIQDSGSEYSFVPPSADEVRHKVLNRTRRGFGQYLVNHLMSAVKLRSSKSKGNVLILEKALL